ncbi:MAG: ATP-binding cassette domain-containing protein [Candidatus Heimdallarchaeota archaeon]|nr:ATP-binding cassette domain-containing protein [Candidatus Heimdallarchaeota archaeon]
MLRVKNLSVRYEESTRKALDSINFDVSPGEFVIIAGASGSGKSTLAQALIQLIPNFVSAKIDGSITYKNKEIINLPRTELLEIFGYVPQYPSDFTTSLLVEEEIAFTLENLAIKREKIIEKLENSLSLMEIEHLRHRLVTELSSGELQRVALASALAFKPALLVLDEPIARIDPKTEIKLVNILRKIANQGHIVLAFEHRLDYILAEADRIILLEKGKIIADGKPSTFIDLLINIDPPEISEIAYKKNKTIISIEKAVDIYNKVFPKTNRKEFLPKNQSSSEEDLLKIRDLSFKYTRSAESILQNINISTSGNKTIGLMGINGSGKSTLIKLISRINRPQEGGVYLRDKRIKSIRKAKNDIALVPENAKLFLIGPTPLKDLTKIIGVQIKAEQIYMDLGLVELMNKKLYHLSEGERRLIAIINSFYLNDQVIMIDEPTIGLDKKGREILAHLLEKAKEKNKIVIIASNDPRIIPKLDRLIIIEDHKICLDGSPREVLYDLEEQTELLPNQVVRFIQALEKKLGISLPHFIDTDELNEYLKEVE